MDAKTERENERKKKKKLLNPVYFMDKAFG